MLALLAILTLLSGKIYSLAEQQRSATRVLVQRSQAMTILYSLEDMVLKKLPVLDIYLFQRLTGEAESGVLSFDFPLPQGEATARLSSAQNCLNLAPLREDEPVAKALTQKLVQNLLGHAGLTADEANKLLQPGGMAYLPRSVSALMCYLPGAGQHWDINRLGVEQGPLLAAALPDENVQTLMQFLSKGLTAAEVERINTRLDYSLLVTSSHYYWMTVALHQSASILRGRDLVKVDGRQAAIIRRHLWEDEAL